MSERAGPVAAVIADYHVHLRDPRERLELTEEAVERFVEAAAVAGIDEIGFSEHIYYFREAGSLWELPYQIERCRHALDTYCDAIERAKRRGLPVKLGLEVDYLAGREGETEAVLRGYPWDYLLGSVHWVEGLAVDQEPGLWQGRSVEEVWRLYFDHLGRAAGSRLFDSLSHPDLPKIFGRRPRAEVVEALHVEAADAIAAARVAVEISTAGLRRPVGELYPDEPFLAACRERGVGITMGSDAHVPSLVGRDFRRAVARARSAGYETVSIFSGRRATQESIGPLDSVGGAG